MTSTQLTIEQAIERQQAGIGEILASTNEQAENLERVSKRIAGHVTAFLRLVGVHGQFHAADLLQAVSKAVAPMKISPDSPIRILRDLRQRGEIDYVILNRRQSLYSISDIGDGK